MMNIEPWVDITPPDTVLNPDLIPLLSRRGGREISQLGFQHKGGAASSSKVAISPRRSLPPVSGSSRVSELHESGASSQLGDDGPQGEGWDVDVGQQGGAGAWDVQGDAGQAQSADGNGAGKEQQGRQVASAADTQQQGSSAAAASAAAAGGSSSPHSSSRKGTDTDTASGGASQGQREAGREQGSTAEDLAAAISACAGPRAGEACRLHVSPGSGCSLFDGCCMAATACFG